MIKRGAAVRVHCRQCEEFFDVDLVAVRRARGPDHSLIDASTDCRISRCRGRAYFLAAPSMEETFLLLVNADMVQRGRLESLRPLDVEPPTSDEPPPPPAQSAAVAA
jgi:hypothetical protein